MPNRILKESICTSDEIDALSDSEEAFFYRLMVNVDDFGLLDARPAIIKSKCYPLKAIDIECIQAMLVRLHTVGLIRLYAVDGRQYLAMTTWAKHQQIRAKRSKYPTPEEGSDINCNQVIANVPVIQSNPIQSNPNLIQSDTPEKPARFDPVEIDLPDCIPRQAWMEWIDYRRKRKLTTAEQTIRKQVEALAGWHAEGHSASAIIDATITNGWQGLFPPKETQQKKPAAKDTRFHFDTPEYRAQIAAEAQKYRPNLTPEQLAMANEEF